MMNHFNKCVCVQFINGGDLDRLVTKPNVMLSWKQRVRLAHDVASGMKYLNSVGIFHRDLSAKVHLCYQAMLQITAVAQ